MRRHCPNVLSLLAVALLLAATALTQTGRAETLPYRAHVAPAAAELRSGPGDDYYVTDTLPEGREVDVYREQPDGWCAVRPPQGSYSWVFGRHVRLLAGGLGEVNKEDVASRVGSRASDQRDAVQVHLAKGEVVQILGADDRDGQTWYKIAPPSGEFRWVRKSDLVSDGRLEPAGPAHIGAPQDTPPTTVAAPAPSDAWHAAPQPAPQEGVVLADGATDSRAVTASHEQPGEPPASASPWQPVAKQAAAPPSDVTGSATAPAGAANVVADDFARQVADLELRLSQMVAQPTVAWRIDQLEAEGQRLLSSANDVAQRDAAKGALAKIDRFAAIFRRYQWASAQGGGQMAQVQSVQPLAAGQLPAANQPGSGTTRLAQPAASSSQPPASSIQQPASSPQPQYDAVGLLRPVVSQRPGAPQYALVNDQGQVVSFVTPAPDLNLQPYLGRRIAIVGGRGYIPEFQRAHVTASRVTPLGGRMLR